MCEGSKIRELEARIQELEKENLMLRKENEELKKQLSLIESKLEKHQSIVEHVFKPNKGIRQKKLGAKPGHKGYSRGIPKHVDEEIELSFDACPYCKGKLSKTQQVYPHYVEDIKPVKPYVKKYNIHKKYCKKCKKLVYPKPIDVIPHCRFGLRLMLFVCFQKFGLALPYNKIAFELWTYFGIKVSEAELCQIVQKVAELFGAKFQELKGEFRKLKVKNIDETGWRINGKNHWLWAFISEKIALYKIDESRGSKVPKKVLGKRHRGIISSDFYSAYNKLEGEQQKSWAHLLRETSKLANSKDATQEHKELHKKLKKLYKDAVRLKATKSSKGEKECALKKFLKRLDEISDEPYVSLSCQRIAKRLRKHRENMFRFIMIKELEPDNNMAERGIRPNVVIRKISYGNRSENGAKAHEVMMSIVETYKKQDLNFFDEGMMYLKNQLTMSE